MNQKFDKLISFYKDKSISQEEKRTVAVKIVENILASGSQSQEETKTFIFEGKRYDNVGVNIVYDLFKKQIKNNNELKERLNYEMAINSSLKNTQNELNATLKELTTYKIITMLLLTSILIEIIRLLLIRLLY